MRTVGLSTDRKGKKAQRLHGCGDHVGVGQTREGEHVRLRCEQRDRHHRRKLAKLAPAPKEHHRHCDDEEG